MNVKPGLTLGAAGLEVAALHESLTVIGFQISDEERDAKSFGATTLAAMLKLQALAGLEQTGALDDNAIAVINLALQRLGIDLDDERFRTRAADRAVSGKATDENGEPVKDAKVVILSWKLRANKKIAEGHTDGHGEYRIAYEAKKLYDPHRPPDLQVRLERDGKPPFDSAILFNAPRQATIDLAVGGSAHARPSELTQLEAHVMPLLGKLTPETLEQSTKHMDLSFISEQSGLPLEHLALWATAAHTASETQLPLELFYGLYRKGVPADAGPTALAATPAEGVDLQANAERLKEGVRATATAAIEAALKSAAAANIIPATYPEGAAADLKRLEALAREAALNSTQGLAKTPLAGVLGAVNIPAQQQSDFVELYVAAGGALRPGFWAEVSESKKFTEAQVSDLRFAVTLGRITQGHLPLIDQLVAERGEKKITEASDLATLTTAEWIAVLEKPQPNGEPIGVPAFISGANAKQKFEIYATRLERMFTQSYPTPALAARLAADGNSPFKAAAPTAKFLAANPAVELRRANLDQLATTTAIAPEVRETLDAAQRLVKLHPDYAVMSALMGDGIHSAQQIYELGKQRFITDYAGLLALGPTEAARVFARAEQTHSIALSLVTKLNATLSASGPIAIGNPITSKLIEKASASYPTMQTLFGAESLCECEQCQSVLGDAAYLTDTLDFLGKRGASGAASALAVLLKRRPDLAQIELNCENTDTELPYIDLVNELLEEAVAPQDPAATPARKRQTTLTTRELDANPEYLNETAYKQLAKAVFPWSLPFDLPLSEARTYLAQLGLSRAELIAAFQKPIDTPPAQLELLARERLGLSLRQAEIITAGPSTTATKPWEWWGFQQQGETVPDPEDPSQQITGGWEQKLARVLLLLARAGLSYQELVRLLNTTFVNPAGTIAISPASALECKVNDMVLEGLDEKALERIHRFVRLWRCVGWSVYDLDAAIASLQSEEPEGAPRLNPLLLRQLAAVANATKRYGLSVQRAVALLAPQPGAVTIATREVPTPPGDEPVYSLYHELFENKTVLNPPDAHFKLNGARTAIEAKPAPPLSEHRPALIAALGISESELAFAIEEVADHTGELTLANLSALFAAAQLASMLQVTVEELVTLIAIAEGPDAAEQIKPFAAKMPESLERFAAAAATIASSGLSIAQIDYLLRGADAGGGLAPEAATVGSMLLALYNGLVRIARENTPRGDPTGELTRKALAALLAPKQVNSLMALLAGTPGETQAQREQTLAKTLTETLDGYLDAAEVVTVAALAPGAASFEGLLSALLAYEVRTQSTGLIVQTLASALGLNTAITALLLDWFPSHTAAADTSTLTDFLDLPSKKHASAEEPITEAEAEFEPYFRAYTALAKAAMIINALKLNSEDVRWWSTGGIKAGWLNPTMLPPIPAQPAPTATAEGRFYALTRIFAACRLRRDLPGPVADFATLFTTPPERAESLQTLSERTKWDAGTLEALCGTAAEPSEAGQLALTYPADFACETALSRIVACQAILARTRIPATLGPWLEDDVSSEAATAIRQSVKGNYSDERWNTVAKKLRDPLREAQRDALVSYLLAGEPLPGAQRWLNPDDVFDHFLIDVEMGACMSTSRIVQATAAVQLFVQRCFIGLEPDVPVDAKADEKWLQWRWMSQYRLWQANREVFLFPENWLDPGRRSSASPIFEELAQELQQGQLASELAETAVQKYLEGLETVARLDVCGYFDDHEPREKPLSVLARTQATPPTYYTREWLEAQRWTPWQKVNLDIDSNHVVPVTWQGRRYIFWLVVTKKGNQDQSAAVPAPEPTKKKPPAATTHLEVKLAWSQYKHGRWQAKQSTQQSLIIAVSAAAEPKLGLTDMSLTVKSSQPGQKLQLDVFMEAEVSSGVVNNPRVQAGRFLLGGAGSGVEVFIAEALSARAKTAGGGTVTSAVAVLPTGNDLHELHIPQQSVFAGDWLTGNWPAPQAGQSTLRPWIGPMNTTCETYGNLTPELVLRTADPYMLVVPHQTPKFDSTLPFFYRDASREFFVVPQLYYLEDNYLTINAPPYVYDPTQVAQYTFAPFYHPFCGMLVAQLNIGGADALYAQAVQLEPATVAGLSSEFDFKTYYEPTGYVWGPYPKEQIEFGSEAAYSLYNWELFYHVPFLIANALSTNQQFESALDWYEYVFRPRGGEQGAPPENFWVTKPFNETTKVTAEEQQITELMEAIDHRLTPELERQVAVMREDPFDPDVIAQLRPVAYQRAIFMRFIDNLIAWGDQLFRTDTRESINLATQMYVLAEEMLGPRPQIVPPGVAAKAATYEELEGKLDEFSNASVVAENLVPPVSVDVPAPPGAHSLPTLSTLYFRIPPNAKLLKYWDTIAEQLGKIRHCENIEGQVQQLALFAPAIEPGLLVAAAAAGADLTSVLSEVNAAPPPYRFTTMIRHALELCEQVRGLGGELLAALEKTDAEALARIRSVAEVGVQAKIEEVRAEQLQAAEKELEVLAKSKQSFIDRQEFYVGRELMNAGEAAALTLKGLALIPQVIATVLDSTAAVAHALPDVEAGAAGAGGSPVLTLKIGGSNVGDAAGSGASVSRMVAAAMQTSAEITGTLGGYQQRADDWALQGRVAEHEIIRVEAEEQVAEIRKQVALKELEAQEKALEEAREVDAFLHEKFTNHELYEWMVRALSTTYFQAYQLAYAIAKAAERCYRRELPVRAGQETPFVQFGSWDGLHNGLLAGERLHGELRRMQSAYLTSNEREKELTRSISLRQLDPYALVQLRQSHECQIELSERLFDLENPGHYMRRLKNVAVTIPCVVGPYTAVSATLTLLENHIRVSPEVKPQYERNAKAPDERFLDDPGGAEIITSSAQADSGLFELRFEDERYLPFETAGAVSRWQLKLNNVYPQFDYSTITDVVLHVRYTARDGGSELRQVAAEAAKNGINQLMLAEQGREGLFRMFSARSEYPSNWAQFLDPAPGEEQVLEIQTPPERFPFFTRGYDLTVSSIDLLALTSGGANWELAITEPTGESETQKLQPTAAGEPLAGLLDLHKGKPKKAVDLGTSPLAAGAQIPTWKVKLTPEGAAALGAGEVQDIVLIVGYQMA